jgi:uncharacterized membrane protein
MAALLLGFPAIALAAEKRVKAVAWLSPVMCCYVFGIVLANLPLDLVHDATSRTAMEAAVPLAIPLLLLSTRFGAWLRLARRTVIAFALALVSSMVLAILAAKFLVLPGEESWKVAGMLVGVYTGGTPNMAAIGWALDVADETFVLLNAVDMLWGGAYFLLLLSVVPRLLRRVLPRFDAGPAASEGDSSAPEVAPLDLGSPRTWAQMAAALGVAAVAVGGGAGISFLITGKISEAVVIIALSTLGIGASLIGPLRRLRGSYELGNYAILVFCVAIGSQAEVSQLIEAGPRYLLYVGAVMFGAIVLHLALCALFRVDADTAIITSTAAIYGPAFIGPVAARLGNREMVVSGITAGLLGIALGNYLGLALAWALGP